MTHALGTNSGRPNIADLSKLVLTVYKARSGLTSITVGQIRVEHADALGGGEVTASGGTLEIGGGVTFDKAITLTALGTLRGTGTSAATGQIVVDNATLVTIAAGAEGETFTVGNAT